MLQCASKGREEENCKPVNINANNAEFKKPQKISFANVK